MNIINILSPLTTYYYRGYATNPNAGTGYSEEGTFTTLVLPPDATIVSFVTDKSKIGFQEAVTLSWSSKNADSCVMTSPQDLTGNFINLSPNGSKKLFPKKTSIYSIRCTGEGGISDLAQVTVTVGKIRPTFNEQ